MVLAPFGLLAEAHARSAIDWQGRILDTHWVPTMPFHLAHPELYTQQWVQVATEVGTLFLNEGSLDASLLRVDNLLQWHHTRLDLYAVI